MICKIFRIPIKYGGHSHTWELSYPEVVQFVHLVPDGGTDRPHDVVRGVLQPEQEDDDEDREGGEAPAATELILLRDAREEWRTEYS